MGDIHVVPDSCTLECSRAVGKLVDASGRRALRGMLCIYALDDGGYSIDIAGTMAHDNILALGYMRALEHQVVRRACPSPDCPLMR